MASQDPPGPQELLDFREYAEDSRTDCPEWVRVTMLTLIAEIDRLAYMWHKGGPDDLITGEDGHLIVNGTHACAPQVCDRTWRPPPAESWTLPAEGDGDE